MSSDVVRGALWVNDLMRLHRPERARGQYELIEVRALAVVPQLAQAMDVGELVVRERLERGCRAHAVWSCPDETPVSWVWVSTGSEYALPLRRTLQIPDGDCYGWNGGTVETQRGRGLLAWLLDWAGSEMAASGLGTMWCGILDSNLPSRRACARAGFRPVLRVAAVHEPPAGRLRTWPADYADERLVARARQMVGVRAAAPARRAA